MSAARLLPSTAVKVPHWKHQWVFHNSLNFLLPLWHTSVSPVTLSMINKARFANPPPIIQDQAASLQLFIYFSFFSRVFTRAESGAHHRWLHSYTVAYQTSVQKHDCDSRWCTSGCPDRSATYFYTSRSFARVVKLIHKCACLRSPEMMHLPNFLP